MCGGLCVCVGGVLAGRREWGYTVSVEMFKDIPIVVCGIEYVYATTLLWRQCQKVLS